MDIDIAIDKEVLVSNCEKLRHRIPKYLTLMTPETI